MEDHISFIIMIQLGLIFLEFGHCLTMWSYLLSLSWNQNQIVDLLLIWLLCGISRIIMGFGSYSTHARLSDRNSYLCQKDIVTLKLKYFRFLTISAISKLTSKLSTWKTFIQLSSLPKYSTFSAFVVYFVLLSLNSYFPFLSSITLLTTHHFSIHSLSSANLYFQNLSWW